MGDAKRIRDIKALLQDTEEIDTLTNEVVRQNPRYFAPDGTLLQNLASNTQLNIGDKTKSVRAKEMQAVMLRLRQRNPDDGLLQRMFDRNTIFPSNQSRVRDALLDFGIVETATQDDPFETATKRTIQVSPQVVEQLRQEQVIRDQENELQRIQEKQRQAQSTKSDQQLLKELRDIERLLVGDLTEPQLNQLRNRLNMIDTEKPDILRKVNALGSKIITKLLQVQRPQQLERTLEDDIKQNLDEMELLLANELTIDELNSLEMTLSDTASDNPQIRERIQTMKDKIRDIKQQMTTTTEVQTDESIPADLPELIDIPPEMLPQPQEQGTQTQAPTTTDVGTLALGPPPVYRMAQPPNIVRASNEVLPTTEMGTQTDMAQPPNIVRAPNEVLPERIEALQPMQAPQAIQPLAPMQAPQAIQPLVPMEAPQVIQPLAPVVMPVEGSQPPIVGAQPPLYIPPPAGVLNEPRITRQYFNREGLEIDMNDDSLEGRLNQIEYFASFVEEFTDIPDDIRASASQVINTIRESKQANEESHSIFSKIYNVGKKVLVGIAAIPIIPPFIRAPAAATLVGVEAIEQTIGLVRGTTTSTDAVRAGINLVGSVIPEVGEVAGALNTGLDLLEGAQSLRQRMRIANRDEQTREELETTLDQSNENLIIRTTINIPEGSKPVPEVSLGGSKNGDNEYYENPIHSDALNIYFGDCNFPQWDKEIFNGRDKYYSQLNEEDYVLYLQQQSFMIWNKHHVEMLVPRIMYDKPTDPPELIIKENRELIQLMNVIIGVRTGMDIKELIKQLDKKLDRMIEADENDKGREKGSYDKTVKPTLDSTTQNKDGKIYFAEKKTLAEEVTSQGMPDVSTREIMSLGWSATGRKYDLSNLKKGQNVSGAKITIPSFTDETLKLSQIRNIRI